QENYRNSEWNAEQFVNFSEHDFEKYYPCNFKNDVDKVLNLRDQTVKRIEKKTLLSNVEKWISENEVVARQEFQISAKEIIDLLRMIAEKIAV
ncbi:MAG: hypothetical protein QG607_506, partial [Patescibacteria group bacterium]|nr:hypothetical protein [Patescibacteria group bacterium]